MKLLTTIALLVSSLQVSPAHAESELGGELQKLRGSYEEAVQTALAPINQGQAARLQDLLKRAQAARDRQSEIDTLTELRKLGTAAIRYEAQVTFEFSPSDEINAERVLSNTLGNDPFVSALTQIRNTGLFELRVIASDPKFAADYANDVAANLQRAIEARKGFPPIKVWERAEPPSEPIAIVSIPGLFGRK